MAIAEQGRSITFTAVNESLGFGGNWRRIIAMSFQGTGLTAAQRLVVRDTATVGSGNILADYQTEAATDNADLWGGRKSQVAKGLSIDNNTIAGTWTLTVTIAI